jgi:hypothetical protein
MLSVGLIGSNNKTETHLPIESGHHVEWLTFGKSEKKSAGVPAPVVISRLKSRITP